MVLHSSKSKYDLICRSVDEPFRDLEFYVSFLEGNETIPVFTLLAGSPGDLRKTFEIEMDKESISINRNRYITGDNFSKRRFRLNIQNGSSGFQAGLIVSEKMALSGIDSLNTIDPTSEYDGDFAFLCRGKVEILALSVFQFKFIP